MYIYCIYKKKNNNVIYCSESEQSCIKMCNALNQGKDIFDWRAVNLNFLIDFYMRKC